ncbi:MAG: methyltransferase domain-containing protein [Candidatus Omnitrophota bacterium]|nr:methyltransferase domain-containing protein [Candidatus Omnitrophota bacterium]
MSKNNVLFERWNELKTIVQDFPEAKELFLHSEDQYLMKYIIKDIPKDFWLKGRILDIGAGDRALENLLRGSGFKGIYKSLDVDKSVGHDFKDISEVKEKFDFICLLELIEHLELAEGIKYFELCKELLDDNGCLYISTPNIFHPTYFWSDPTHIQHYPIKFLYGILKLLGFCNIELYKLIELPTKKTNIYRSIKSKIRFRIWRTLGFERAVRIFVKCNKPPAQSS